MSVSTDGTDPRLPTVFAYNEGKVNITEESSLGLAVVYACVDRISNSIASLPWDVLTQSDERTSLKAYRHPVYKLLHTQPHPLYTSSTFRRVMLAHRLLWGNFYAEIQLDGRDEPVALKIWKPWDVQVYLKDDRLYYKLSDGRILQDYEIIHLKGFSTDGLLGRSLIRISREAFQMGMETQRFGTSFYQNGTRLSGVMMTEKNVARDAKKMMREDFEEQYGPQSNGHGKTAFLSDGWKYQQLGIPPDDAQFLDTRKFTRTEICSLFGVPPHMVMDLEHATFSNIENQNIWYVTHTLMPYIVDIEQEFGRKLFRDSEQETLANKINVHGLLRGDTAAQTAHLSAMLDRGVYSPNMALGFLDQNPYEGGDQRMVQGAMTPVDLLREFYESKIKSGDASQPQATS